MKLIPLTKGLYTMVDDDDYLRMAAYKWYSRCKPNTAYARGRVQGKMKYLHSIIMNAQPGQMIDHIDGNGLNNQRSNLRFCTAAQNQHNRRRRCDNKSKYKGVRINMQKVKRVLPDGTVVVRVYKSIEARIYLNRRQYKHLGTYATEEEAALAYNAEAKKQRGEFARLNIVPND